VYATHTLAVKFTSIRGQAQVYTHSFSGFVDELCIKTTLSALIRGISHRHLSRVLRPLCGRSVVFLPCGTQFVCRRAKRRRPRLTTRKFISAW